MKDSVPLYFRYWGKAERDGVRYHLLPYHFWMWRGWGILSCRLMLCCDKGSRLLLA